MKGCSAEICWIIDSFICETLVLMLVQVCEISIGQVWARGIRESIPLGQVLDLARGRAWQQRAPESFLSFCCQPVPDASEQMRLSGFSPESAGFYPFLRDVFFRMHWLYISGAVNGEMLLIRGCSLAV